MPAMRRPWPVTPMKRARPSSRARTRASTAPPGPWASLPLVGLDQVVQLDEVDLVDPQPLERALEAGPGAGRRCARRSWWPGRSRPGGCASQRRQAQLGLAVAGRRVEVVDPELVEHGQGARRPGPATSSPRAAAPKITRLLRWPVRPNGARAITPPPAARPVSSKRSASWRISSDDLPRSLLEQLVAGAADDVQLGVGQVGGDSAGHGRRGEPVERAHQHQRRPLEGLQPGLAVVVEQVGPQAGCSSAGRRRRPSAGPARRPRPTAGPRTRPGWRSGTGRCRRPAGASDDRPTPGRRPVAGRPGPPAARRGAPDPTPRCSSAPGRPPARPPPRGGGCRSRR